MSETFIGVVIGLLAGVASGLAGVGGGIILVPGMIYALSISQHTAQGTSTVAMLFTAAAGTFVNVRNRHVHVSAASLVGLAGAITGFLGARLAVGVDADLLRRLFGIVVVFSGVRMGLGAWRTHRAESAGS